MAKANLVLQKVAQFKVGDQVFNSIKEANAFLHREEKLALAKSITTAPKDEAGNPVKITGLVIGQRKQQLVELFDIGTIQRQKKSKVHPAVETALDALLAECGDGDLAEFLVANEERFQKALNAFRPVMTDEQRVERTAMLNAAREKMLAEKAAKKAEAEAAKKAAEGNTQAE